MVMAQQSEQGELERLLCAARACRLCAAELPLGPRPVLRARATARLLIVSQAPGTRVHETGLPFDDPSGDRLRAWLAVNRETFYDQARIAFLPMGLCYPGRNPRGGDKPPRHECAPLWHPPLLAALPAVELTLLIGGYAQRRYLAGHRHEGRGRGNLTETVRAWADTGSAVRRLRRCPRRLSRPRLAGAAARPGTAQGRGRGRRRRAGRRRRRRGLAARWRGGRRPGW